MKAFCKFGYAQDHKSGSHIILYHPNRPPLSIPDHKSLAPGLLRGQIRKAGLDLDMWLEALR